MSPSQCGSPIPRETERRAVEKMLKSAITSDYQTFQGRYYSGNELTDQIMPQVDEYTANIPNPS